MKIKIITAYYYSLLEENVNDFIEDKEVINISLSEDSKQCTVTALILYKE